MKARILVVDDNALNRKLAGDLLELEGYEVAYCEDADETRQLLASDPLPDLILMDISLPGMDGLTLTRLLRADRRLARIPIVALTAFAMKGDEEKARSAGCIGYITKPIDTRRLPHQVEEYLAAHARTPPTPTSLSVMVVEDHRVDLKLAGERIRMHGHIALDITTAEAAIEDLVHSRPDVILLDLNLPGMDGLSFVRRLKGDPKTAGLPIVAITAFPERFAQAELLAAGCVAMMTKPVSMPDLLRQLELAAESARSGPAVSN